MQLPDDFCRMTISALGEAEYHRLVEALAQPAPTSIRVNDCKAQRDELADNLRFAEQVTWCDNGYYLAERPQFTFDPLLHAGCYYVQEASSMFIAKILQQYAGDAPVVALDACAAPGGKSTLMLNTLPEGSLLVANEYVRQRAHVLVENLMKWGNPHVVITNSDTRDFAKLSAMFDVVVCDAPCSGEGMFRKDPKSIEEWSVDNVKTCWMRQREIVQNLWSALRPGGLFIYSTCTYNSLEDEDNVAWMRSKLNATPLSLPRLNEDDKGDWDGHFYPHRTKGEGFFVAAFTKDESADADDVGLRKKTKTVKGGKGQPKIPVELKGWIDDARSFTITQNANGTFYAFPSAFQDKLTNILSATNVVHYGIALAETKGNKLQPCHNLALSLSVNAQAFASVDVDYTTAIAYLRGEALTLPATCPKGFVLITYRNHNLGFVKNIGNRANNLYPAEWRIKTTHVPV